MALDASLILGGKGPQLDDPLTIRAKQATLADLMGRQQLQQMQMQGKQLEMEDAQRARQDQQTLADLYRTAGTDPNALMQGMAQQGLGARIPAFQEQQAKTGKAITEADAARFDLIKKKVATTNSVVASVLASNPNPTHQDVYQAIARAAAQYGLSPEEQSSMARGLPGDESKLRGFLIGNALQAAEVGKQIDMLAGKTELVDKGGAHQAYTTNQLTGQVTPGQTFEKTATPEAVMTDKRTREEGAANRGVQIRGQNLTDARARETNTLQKDAARTEVKETADGFVLVDKGTGKVTALAGADGKPLGPKLKDAPAAIQKAMIENGTNIRRAEQALALVQGNDVGEAKGDKSATGFKGYLPNQLLNRVDPEGVDARAAIADLGSLVIHDRSGAAVTAAEFPRLAPFIPSEKDDQATIQKKLKRFVQVYRDEMSATEQAYGPANGFRPLGAASAGGGATVKLPNGQTLTFPSAAAAAAFKKEAGL